MRALIRCAPAALPARDAGAKASTIAATSIARANQPIELPPVKARAAIASSLHSVAAFFVIDQQQIFLAPPAARASLLHTRICCPPLRGHWGRRVEKSIQRLPGVNALRAVGAAAYGDRAELHQRTPRCNSAPARTTPNHWRIAFGVQRSHKMPFLASWIVGTPDARWLRGNLPPQGARRI